MNDTPPSRPLDLVLTAMRIAVGLAYFSHGAQKLFGWFGGFGRDGGTAGLMTECVALLRVPRSRAL